MLEESPNLKRILVVDDEETIRRTIQKRLTREGYDVRCVGKASEALQEFRSHPFDTVISDIRMEEMDGVELLQKIKDVQRDDVPVIMITGAPSLDTAQSCIKAGAYDYIIKPFDKETLLNTVKRALEKKELTDRVRAEKENLEIRVQEQTRTLRDIYRFANRLNSLDSLEAVLESIVEFVADFMVSERVSIMLLDEKQEYLTIATAVGLEEEIIRNTRVARGEAIAGRVLETQKALRIDDISTIKSEAEQFSRYKALISFPLMQAPLKSQTTPLGIINVTNRFGDQPYTALDLRNLDFIADTASVAINNQIKGIKLQESYFATMKSLALALDAKDRYTAGHSESVQRYSVSIARQMNLGPEEVADIERAGALHDIGKIGIPDAIINKPGRLTQEEFQKIKEHPAIGEQMILPIPFLSSVRGIIRHHHERFDGSGYPDGVKGEEIELGARIMAVADTFDAMTSDRPYRKALTTKEALAELNRCRDTQFDPQVVRAFEQVIEKEEHDKAGE
ncbi:MAG: response regulator [Deltaproteobacteria bacterium]|nr:response regulator [Deltaproteobacteria bacterium]